MASLNVGLSLFRDKELVPDYAELLNFHLNNIVIFQPDRRLFGHADATGRSCQNDGARSQCVAATQVSNNRSHIKEQVVRPCVLP